MSSVSSSSSCHPSVASGGIVGWSVDSTTLGRTVLAAVPECIPNVLVSLMTSYVSASQEGVFAESDWNELCGRVKPAPPLPLNIEDIWDGPCPIFPGQRLKESHVLVYLPTTVDDKPLTLKTFGEIAKQRYFKDNEMGYNFIWNGIVEQLGDQPVGTASWVLMSKTVIEGSRKKSYAIQQTMITDLAKKAGVAYTAPTTSQASICILTHFIRTGTRLFSNTFTRCQERLNGDYNCYAMVGNFSPNGLDISSTPPIDPLGLKSLGVAALRKL